MATDKTVTATRLSGLVAAYAGERRLAVTVGGSAVTAKALADGIVRVSLEKAALLVAIEAVIGAGALPLAARAAECESAAAYLAGDPARIRATGEAMRAARAKSLAVDAALSARFPTYAALAGRYRVGLDAFVAGPAPLLAPDEALIQMVQEQDALYLLVATRRGRAFHGSTCQPRRPLRWCGASGSRSTSPKLRPRRICPPSISRPLMRSIAP